MDLHQHSDFIIDVKVTIIKSVQWLLEMGIGRPDADKTASVLENHTLTQAEDEKFHKHETNYAFVGFACFPFVLGCCGGIGSQAARFLCTLAFLELRQHDAWPCFPLLIALSFSLGFFRQESEGFRLLWPRLLSCVLLELLLILHQPPSLIQNVLPIALDLLI